MNMMSRAVFALILGVGLPMASLASSAQMTEAQAVVSPAPTYPESAIEKGIAGLVLLKVDIEATGQPYAFVAQNEDANPVLVAAAIQSVKQWKFLPATKAGQPVASSMTIPVRFKLKDLRYHNGSVLGPTAPWTR